MTTNIESKKSAEPRDRTQSNATSSGTNGDVTAHAKQGLEAGERGADAAGATGDVSRIAGERGWGATLQGMRIMSAIQAHFAEASLDQSRRVLGTAFQVAETYRAATDRTANRVQALSNSWTHAGRGLQNWHQECLAQFHRSAEHLSAKQQDLSQCRSPAEFVKVQYDIYVGAINDLLRANAVLCDVVAKTAQDTATSLRDREAMTT
jgi:Phasin protein